MFTKLKQHFARYTLEVGEEISGVPAEQIKLIAETFANNRPGTILYALGMTQHTVGIQNIRCYGILQLLLGNIGKAGGGVNALRGEPNVQGACDMSVLNGYMFGYINAPNHNQPDARGLDEGQRHVPPEVHRQRPQGVVRRQRHGRERLRLTAGSRRRTARRTTPSTG